ncbi:MAG TPA: apolipoprotein N-acyltransferase [Myxococcota bacterium]|nr:apolipoprotein N-acyltransferase [Myxococcota bacterium]
MSERARRALAACIGALASGAALAVCAQLPRFGPALALVALAPWLVALDAQRSLRGALLAAAAFCFAYVALVLGWFAAAISAFTGASATCGWLALAALAPALEPQVFTFAAARFALRARGVSAAAIALGSACVWVATEWALPKLLGDSLGLALHPAPALRQGADLAGVSGLTLIVLLVNDCARECSLRARGVTAGSDPAVAPPGRRLRAAAPLALGGALVAALASYGALRGRALDAEIARAPRIRAALVQANIARYGALARELGTGGAVAQILEAHFALSFEALAREPLDLVVWPETVYPTTFGAPKSEDGAAFDRAIAAYAARAGAPLVFGAHEADAAGEYNAAIFLEADGAGRVSWDAYRKAAPFPLTERVPAWLDSPWLRERAPWLGSWRAGAGAKTVSIALPRGGALRAAPLICYDALDASLARAAVSEGAQLLLVLSNDSWFAQAGGPRLHLLVAAFRSIETGRAQLRAANTGISAAISPRGEIVASLGVGERGALVAEAPLIVSRPPHVRLGDWLGPLACAVAIAHLALAGSRRRGAPRAITSR